MPIISTLSPVDFAGSEFLDLLREAVAVEDPALQKIIETELPRLTVIGIREAGSVVAFAACNSAPRPMVLEYIAVRQESRSKNYGRALIQHVRDYDRAKELIAETDDDAVNFYRRLGFSVSDAPTDARWPNRRRYRCVLQAEVSGG